MGERNAQDPYLTKQREEIAERALEEDEKLMKDWRYVDDPSEAPDDANVEEAPQTDRYRYQTDGSGGDGDSGGSGGQDSGNGGVEEITTDDVDRITIDALAENVALQAQEYGQNPDTAAESFYQAVERGEDLAEAYAANTEGTSSESVREMLSEEESFDIDYGSDSGGDSGAVPEGDEGGSVMDEIDEPYKPDSELGQQAVEQMGEINPEAAVEYTEEALHQDGSYFENFDSPEEVVEDFEVFLEHNPDYDSQSSENVNNPPAEDEGGGESMNAEDVIPDGEPTITNLEQGLEDAGLGDDEKQEVIGHVLELVDIQETPRHERHEEAFSMGFEDMVDEALDEAGVR